MGAYHAWLTGIASSGQRLRGAISPERTLVISDYELDRAALEDSLGGLPRILLLPASPGKPLPGVSCHCYQPATNPLQWDDAVDAEIGGHVDTAVFFVPPHDVRGKTLMRLRGLGIRRVLFAGRCQSWVTSPLLLALARRAVALGRQAIGLPDIALSRPMTETACRSVIGRAPRRRPLSAVAPLRIAHFVTSLCSGGAERQACLAAVLQHRHGHDVRILSRLGLVGEDAHYEFLLKPHGIPARFIGSRWNKAFLDNWRKVGLDSKLFRDMPHDLARQVADLAGELLADPVDVLHCYVDDCNVPGVIAAALTGTPAVVLSFRNGNPEHFPGLLRPWMRPWYRSTHRRPGVRLCSNSAEGARDYERWLDLPDYSVPVVRNAFVPPAVPDRGEVQRWRRELGIPIDAPVVAGVFRLHPEKRPLYFLECVERLRRALPTVRVVMAGVGKMEALVRERIAASGLGETVTMLGQRRDVPTILAGSDVTLLVSDWEGTPNVLLEAQYCGCVPVATDAGGSREAMRPGETGVIVGLDDRDATVRAVLGLLNDPERRKHMAAAGHAFVSREFAAEALYKANDRLYRDALSDGRAALAKTA
jgi:glycosyltransferase involved in cell wall biosynthesis